MDALFLNQKHCTGILEYRAMFFYSGSAVYNGKPLFDHKGDKGSQRKKPQNAPLCTFVTLRGKKIPARNGRAFILLHWHIRTPLKKKMVLTL